MNPERQELLKKVNSSCSHYKMDQYGTENLLFKGVASEISSDQDVRGKPTTVQADFKVLGKNNSASAIIDAREDSSVSLVTLSYVGGGYPIAADAQVFKLNSTSDISPLSLLNLSVYPNPVRSVGAIIR